MEEKIRKILYGATAIFGILIVLNFLFNPRMFCVYEYETKINELTGKEEKEIINEENPHCMNFLTYISKIKYYKQKAFERTKTRNTPDYNFTSSEFSESGSSLPS